MNIREKGIINNLRSTNPAVKNRQVSDIFYSDKEETKALREIIHKVIRKYYSGEEYRQWKEDLYNTLVSMVCEDILEAPLSTLYGIKKTLPDYLYGMARSCACRRKYIDSALGIDSKHEFLDASRDIEDEPDSDPNGILIIFDHEDAIDEGRTSEAIAKELINKYINLIPNIDYRDILVAIDLNGESHEKVAKRLGISVGNVNTLHRRAKVSLTRAALPDIKKNCEEFFDKYRDVLGKEETDRLDAFFSGGRGSKEKEDDIARSYIRLVKRVKAMRVENSKAWKRAVNEYKEISQEFNS